MLQNGKDNCLLLVLILLGVVSFTNMPGAAISSDGQSRIEPMVLISTDGSKYIAGEKINISIIVKNHPAEPILQYQVVYDPLNMQIVKGVVARDIQPNYTYNLYKTLPDYAPPGRYHIVVSLVSIDGKVFGSASSELVIEANYMGIAGAFFLFILYFSSVLMLFWFIFYCRHFEQGIFNLFALASLALFPIVFFMNKGAADSGFMFAFICLSLGAVLKIVQPANRFPLFFSHIFFRRYGKTPVFQEDREIYSFGRKDLYYIGILLLLDLFSIRRLLISKPIVYYDWFGFGKEALNLFSSNAYEVIAAPIILLIGNELASNVFLLVWIPIASITFYLFAARVLRNRNAGFVAAFIYVFNPAVLDRFLSAHVGILIGYAIMPVVFLLFILSIDSRNSSTSIILSLMSGGLLAFSGLMASQFFYINAILIILYWIFYSALNGFREMKKGISFITIVFFTAVLVASPWLLSSITVSASGFYSSIATQSYVESLSTQTYLFNNLRLIGQSGGPFMENIGYLGFSFWGLLGFVTVLVGFSAHLLYTKKNQKTLLIFSFITLIGFILSTGTMYIGGSYLWLFNNFPFFFAFREPSKFLIIAGFGLSMLAGITVDAVLSIRGIRFGKFLVPLFISVVILSQAIFAWPMFTGDNLVYSQHPEYTMTREYRELGAWMDSQNESFKVIILPYTGFTIRTWHMVSKEELMYIGTASLSSSNSDIYQYSIFMLEAIERGDTSEFSILAGLEGIKYVIVQKDLDTRNRQESPDDYNFIPPFNRFNLSGQLLAHLLETSKEFRKTKEFGPYMVFENLKNNSEEIVSNYDENEPILSMLPDKYKINVYDHAFPAGLGDDPRSIIYRKWIRSDIYEFLEGGVFGRGAVTYGKGYAITKGKSELIIPYTSPEAGNYQLWARLLYAPGRGALNILLDDEKVGSISPESPDFKGFKWVKITDINLLKRTYNVKIMNSIGENVIDQIVFLPSNDLQLNRILNESKNR